MSRLAIVMTLIISFSCWAELEITFEGLEISGPGVITKGCVYGKTESVSDHAPIIWPKEKIATWNITSRLSHGVIQHGGRSFVNHKFLTNDGFALVNAKGEAAIPGFSSEEPGVKSGEPNVSYERRLMYIAQAMKNIFASNEIALMALQEIPKAMVKAPDGRYERDIFASALSPELAIDYPKQQTGRRPINVALVTRAAAPLEQKFADSKRRMQAYCSHDKELCVVSVHLPFVIPKYLSKHCSALVAMVKKLRDQGYGRVVFVGDFNTTDVNFIKYCSKVKNFAPKINSYSQRPMSCKDNQGTKSDRRIDLLIEF